MNLEYIAIILAHELNKKEGKYELSKQTQQRTDLGIELLREKKITKLIMSGGYSDLYGISLAKAMKRYAIEKGVREDSILEEDFSRETVGQLIFVKQGIIKPREFRNIIIVTHNWHLDRIKKKAEFIFGKNYNLEYGGVLNNGIVQRSEEKEQESLKIFQKTFAGIRKGDDKLILNRLLEKHEQYNKYPGLFMEKLKKLISNNKID